MGHKIKGYDVELIGPIGSLIKYKDDRAEQLFVLKANGVEQDVQVRVRGKSRLRLCKFPPLRFNFSESDTEQTVFAGHVFAGQDKIKLVTHCRSNDAAQVDASHEEEILGVLTDIPGLPENDRKRSIDYLDQFFTRAGDKEKMLKSSERRCH